MRKYKIEYICEKCGKPAQEMKDKSNKNWKVLNPICSCGGKMHFKVK